METETRNGSRIGSISSMDRRSIKDLRLVDYVTQRARLPYYHGNITNVARNHPPFLYGLNLMKKLPVHEGCVNTICWNKTGEYILSGSDDCNLCITKPTCMFDNSKDYTVLHKVPTHHQGNIFGAQFLPHSSDCIIVSCSSEGPVIVHDINATDPSQGIFNFSCHSSTIFEVAPIQDEDKIFLSCGEDKTVRLFDLRCHKSCSRASTCPHPALIRNSQALTTLSVHPLNSHLILVGRADGIGLVYDRRKLPNPSDFSREKAHAEYLERTANGSEMPSTSSRYLHPLDGVVSQFQVPDMEQKCRFTSLYYSADGQQVLASYSRDYVYLFNHNRSSQVELIQTLPRSDPKDDANNHDEKNVNNDVTTSSNQATARPRLRPQRIRMRGDWSDTGVNSVPYAARSDSNDSSQRATIMIQRMTEVVCSLSNRRAAGQHLTPNYSTDDNMEDEDEEEVEDEEGEMNDVSVEDNVDNYDIELNEELDIRESPTSVDKRKKLDNKRQISEKMKEKFKNTFAGMKNKFNNIPSYDPRVKYQGHRNSRTSIKKAIFWGDNYIMSGSDCGRIMVWEKNTAKLVMAFPADGRVVNGLAPNPHHYALASSGIDYDIKLWSTQNLLDGPLLISPKDMDEIVKNNELMLEEAKMTITVPSHLFFRVFFGRDFAR